MYTSLEQTTSYRVFTYIYLCLHAYVPIEIFYVSPIRQCMRYYYIFYYIHEHVIGFETFFIVVVKSLFDDNNNDVEFNNYYLNDCRRSTYIRWRTREILRWPSLPSVMRVSNPGERIMYIAICTTGWVDKSENIWWHIMQGDVLTFIGPPCIGL